MTISEWQEARANALDEANELQDIINIIDARLEAAKFEQSHDSEEAPDWFRRAAWKKRIVSQQLHVLRTHIGTINHQIKEEHIRIQKEQAEINRKIKEENIRKSAEINKSDNAKFIEHAKTLLSRDLYLSIWASVNNERGNSP